MPASIYSRIMNLPDRGRVRGKPITTDGKPAGTRAPRAYKLIADEFDQKFAGTKAGKHAGLTEQRADGKTVEGGPSITADRTRPLFDSVSGKWVNPTNYKQVGQQLNKPLEVVAAQQVEEERIATERKRLRGRASTMLTGSTGLLSSPTLSRRSLLGV